MLAVSGAGADVGSDAGSGAATSVCVCVCIDYCNICVVASFSYAVPARQKKKVHARTKKIYVV